MRAAKIFGSKTATVAVLAPGVLYAAASAPEDVQEEIMRRVEAGEAIDRYAFGNIIKQRKDDAAEAKRQEKLTPAQRQKDVAAKRRSKAMREKASEEWRLRDEAQHADAKAACEEITEILGRHFDEAAILRLHEIWRRTQHQLPRYLAGGLSTRSGRQ